MFGMRTQCLRLSLSSAVATDVALTCKVELGVVRCSVEPRPHLGEIDNLSRKFVKKNCILTN